MARRSIDDGACCGCMRIWDAGSCGGAGVEVVRGIEAWPGVVCISALPTLITGVKATPLVERRTWNVSRLLYDPSTATTQITTTSYGTHP